MAINPFRDTLMTTQFDNFRSLLDELNGIKADLKTQHRRISPPIGTYTAYRMIKQVCLPISRIFNSRKYGYQRCIEMFTRALLKLDLLIREMLEYGRDSLTESLRHIYRRLFNLLPKNTVIQHQLFDAEPYNNDQKKKPPTTTGFINWLQDYHLNGLVRRDIERKRARKPLRIAQFSIRFSHA